MKNRDDFPVGVKRALERRAGQQCSFPGCPVRTSGPSLESPDAVANTGTACHIVAAAGGQGARRVVTTMSSAERMSVENGIWMCRNHGTLIDLDEVRFTIPLLQQWRQAAELRAARRQSYPGTKDAIPDLFVHDFTLTRDNLSERLIGDAFEDAGIPPAWGRKAAAATRDFIFEMVQNALTHGGGTVAEVRISRKYISITDNGYLYDFRSLLDSKNRRGGAMSYASLTKALGDRLSLSSHYKDGKNTYTIQYIRSQDDLMDTTPCCIDWNLEIARGEHSQEIIKRIYGCDAIYIILPKYMSFSKAHDFTWGIKKEDYPGKRIILVGNELSEGVIEILEEVPGASFLELGASNDHYFYDES